METRRLKMAAFVNSSLATLQGAVNDFTAGKAVASGTSGTVSYAAGDVGDSELIDQQYSFDGSNHAVVVFYA